MQAGGMTNTQRADWMRSVPMTFAEMCRRMWEGLMIVGGFLGASRHRSRQLDRLLQPWINAWTFSHMRWLRPFEPVRAAERSRPLPKRHRPLSVRYRFDGAELDLDDLHRRTN